MVKAIIVIVDLLKVFCLAIELITVIPTHNNTSICSQEKIKIITIAIKTKSVYTVQPHTVQRTRVVDRLHKYTR